MPAETPAANAQTPNKKTSLWICVALAAITFAVFWQVTKFEFVNFDDTDFITANPQVQSGLNAKSIAWAFNLKTEVARNWHPITMLTHMLDVEIWKMKPGGHHFDNLLLHVANTLLLFLLLKKMTGAIWRSAFVAALFALHPLHVESVAWMAERKDVLSTFFWLLTTWFYVEFARKPNAKNYALSLAAFALGLMSKPMLVTLPFTLLLLDFWPLKRISNFNSPISNPPKAPAQNPKLKTQNLLWLVVEKIPFFILSAALCVITFSIQKKGGAMLISSYTSLSSRISNALISYLRYLGKMIWPENLAGLYLHSGGWPTALVTLAAVFLVLVSVAALLLARKRPYFFAGWFWFFGTLVPVIGIVQVGMQAMADRFTYVPLIGIFIALTWGAWEFAAARKISKMSLSVAGAVVLLACAVVTSVVLPNWKNSERLFTRMITATDKNYMAHYNLGNFYSRGENLEAAVTNYEAAIRYIPDYASAHNNLGGVLMRQRKFDDSIAHYKIAAKITPEPVQFFNLANAYFNASRHAEAIETYQQALRMNPDYSDAKTNLALAELAFANALVNTGKLTEAVAHYSAAAQNSPNPGEVYNGLGICFAMQNKMAEAAQQFETALALNPNDSGAHSNLGNALSAQNKFAEAIPHYLTALKINPQDFQSHFNLGLSLSREGKVDEAKAHYEEALRLNPNYPEAKKALAELNSPPGARK